MPLGWTYNVFRRRTAPDFCCAVPVDRPVPAFLNGRWSYAGILKDGTEHLTGFDPAAAELGVRLSGFHLFQTANPKWASNRERKRPPRSSEELAAIRVASQSAWRSSPSA